VCCREKKTPNGGHISLGKLQPTLRAMVEQVGFREAARRIGCSRASILYWLHLSVPHHGKYAKQVQRATAVRIIQARVRLNDDIKAGRVIPMTNANRKRTRKRAGLCSGCGTDLDNFTDDCGQCWDRNRRREERAA
jgi:hypothetical protein